MPKATCSVDNCERQVYAKGFCQPHYRRFRKHGDPTYVQPRSVCSEEGCEEPAAAQGLCLRHYKASWARERRKRAEPCSEDGCDRPAEKRDGLCNMHYTRLRRYGDLSRGRLTDAERFWKYVDKDGPVQPHVPELGPCWVWTGSLSRGYGQFRVGMGQVPAHRFSWELHYGERPDGLPFVCHRCDHRCCVRPTHLFACTHQQNMDDMTAKKRHRSPVRVLQPCGTPAAYRRHLKAGEVPCEPCRSAYYAYIQSLPRRT